MCKLSEFNLNNGYVRAYRLDDGDIFRVCDTHVEFYDKIFYEVVEDGFDEFRQIKYKRTGKTFTIEDLNNLVKDGDCK